MPDIFARDLGGLRYLLEVKEKLPNAEEERKRTEALREDGTYSHSQAIARQNRLSGIVAEAVEQLASPAAPAADLRLMCFVASGRDPKVQLDQFFRTVYGAWELFDLERNESRLCLYYTFSDFFRHAATLDGILGLDPQGATLWINSFSPRAGLLARSGLAAAMGPGVYDPVAREQAGQVYVADTDLDRRDRGSILLYVQRKYDRWHQLTELSPVAFSAEVVARVEVEDTVGVVVSREERGGS